VWRDASISTNLITIAVSSSPSCFLLQGLLPCCCATSFYSCRLSKRVGTGTELTRGSPELVQHFRGSSHRHMS